MSSAASTNTKSLYRYIFPAVGGLFVTYLYNVVDGIFVGQGVGSAALGAVNIGVPFITFVVEVDAMFPMGGATVVAIRMGRGDKEGANAAFMTAFIMTLLLSAALMITGMVFSEEIIILSGAEKLSDEMRKMATDYLFYYSAFSIPMLLSTSLSVFVRNDGSPTLSFVGMLVGAAANIFLDWLFIFPMDMGVIGAAIASGLGQIFSALVLLSHFLLKRGNLQIRTVTVKRQLIYKICKRGVPEAITQLTTPVTALCYNLMLASLIGDIGVSTFSVLSFIYSLANAILSGVAQGLQPLWGVSYGKKDAKTIQFLVRRGLTINLLLSVVIFGVLCIFDTSVICIFNKDTALVETASMALPYFCLSFVPMSLNLIYTALMFSTKRTTQANIIAISRGFLLKAILIFFIPMLFGSNAIWIAPFFAETFTLIFAAFLSRKTPIIYQ